MLLDGYTSKGSGAGAELGLVSDGAVSWARMKRYGKGVIPEPMDLVGFYVVRYGYQVRWCGPETEHKETEFSLTVHFELSHILNTHTVDVHVDVHRHR